MDIEFNKIDNVNGELTVTLKEEDYSDKVKKQLRQIGQHRPEPGFRPGHVPMGLLEKKYGASVKYDVVNREIGDAVYNYIKENNLRVLGQPIADKDNIFKEDEKDFTFKFKLGFAPEINDHVGKDMKVPYYTIEVTEKMVDEQIESLRKRFGIQGPGEETTPDAVIKGVITELNPDGSVMQDGIVVENGIIAPVHFTDEEQKKLFEGKHPGDIVVFNPAMTCNSNVTEMSSMLNIDKNDVENHKGDFNFEIKEIIVLKPAELDQEFYDNAFGKDQVHDENELKTAVAKMIKDQLAVESNYRFTIDSREAILKAVGNVELPDDVLKDFLINQNKDLTKENIDEEYSKMRPQLIWDLTKDEIISKFKVEVTDEDLMQEARAAVVNQFRQYGGSVPVEMVDRYAAEIVKEPKNHDMFERNALNRKVFEAVKENVTLDEKEISMEDFRKLYYGA